jgi:hypothetical protein
MSVSCRHSILREQESPVEAADRAAAVGLAVGGLAWACLWLIRIAKRWGATGSETVRDLPGEESLLQGKSTTYAISIAVPPEEVWPWLVQIGRARGGFYTYTAIERLLGADIDNLDRIGSQPADAGAWRSDLDDPRTVPRPPPRSVLAGTPGAARASTRSRTKIAGEPTAWDLVLGAGARSWRHHPTDRSAPQ